MVQNSNCQDLEIRVKYLEEKLRKLTNPSEENSVRHTTGRLDLLAEAAHEGVFILEDGICIEANSSGCRMFGYSYEEIIGLRATSVFLPEYQDLVVQKIKEQSPDPYEALAVRKNGETFYALIQGHSMHVDGKEMRVSTVTDITDQKKTQQEIRENQAKYRSILENAADGILVGDLEGKIVEANGSFLKITGYKANELLNRHIRSLFPSEQMEEKPFRFDLLDKGESVIIERNMIGKSGEIIPIEMNSKRVNENYYLAVFRDLRERRKAEEDLRNANILLRQAKERAEESDRLKSAFLANMSHEIRTPLNGIVGFAELLKNRDLSYEEWSSFIDVIVSSGQQLLSIINDVLTISRIETGQVVVKNSPIDLPQLMNELYLFFRASADDTHNELIIEMPENQEHYGFLGDDQKIRQVMNNLINNALKFTWDGEVRFGYEYDMEEHKIRFFVSDNGIGIPKESLSTIFERFVQVEDGKEVNQSGTGLGLSISKKLVEMMGGTIGVESASGEGSRFYFVLPL